MIRLLADLQKIAAEDGTVLAVRDGEATRDGLGGTFEYENDNIDADDGAIIGANIIKPTAIGANPGAWKRIPSKGDQNAADIQDLKNQIGQANTNIDRQLDQALFPYSKKIATLTPLTAAGTILRADALQQLGTISTNQTVTMPSAVSNTNKIIYIYVSNTGAGRWTVSGYGKVRTGKTYSFFSNGSVWLDIGNVKGVEIHTPTAGQTVTFVKDALNVIISTAAFTVAGPASPNYLDTFGVNFALTTGTITWPSSFTTQFAGSTKTNWDFVWDGSHWN